jgi:hypothetical protein
MPRHRKSTHLLSAGLVPLLAVLAHGQAERLHPDSAMVMAGDSPFVLADLNGDGLPDLAYDSTNPVDGMVRLTRPDGSFGPPTLYPQAANPRLAADFTDDGTMDIACFVTKIRVLPGLGDAIKSTVLPGVPEGDLHAADIDGDGQLDIAKVPDNSHAMFFHLGAGDGTFGASTLNAVFDGSIGDHGLADMDGDGDVDVFASADGGYFSSETTAQVGWCANLGDGTFAPAITTLLRGDEFADNVTAHDFDGDGLVDLLDAGGTGPAPGEITILRNVGNGLEVVATFPVVLSSTSSSEVELDSSIGDVDGDALDDIVLASDTESGAGAVFVLPGLGGFDFAPPITSSTDFAGEVYAGQPQFDFIDMDGDGHLDVVRQGETLSVPFSAILVDIAWGRGDGTFETSTHMDAGELLTDVAAADLDGNGACDVLATSIDTAPHLAARLGHGDGTFADPIISPATFADDVLAADATGDGLPDVLATSAQSTGGAMLLVGTGDGTFSGRTPVAQGDVRDAAFGDVNADGVLDLALCQPDQQVVTLLRGVGDGTFVAEPGLPVGADAGGMALADVTSDGIPDIAVTEQGAALLLVYPLTIAFGSGTPVALATGHEPQEVVAADLDGDGDLDLATSCGDLEYTTKDTVVTVHFGEAGDFGPAVAWVAETSGREVAASDLDRDGIPDLIVTARAEPEIPDVPLEVLHGGPAGSQGDRVAMRVNGQLAGVAAADFDGNGHVDLVMALADEPELRIALDRAGNWTTLGYAVPAAEGVPDLAGTGAPVPSKPVSVTATTPSPGQAGLLFIGLDASFAPLAGGFLVPSVDALVPLQSGGALAGRWPAGLPIGTAVYFQAWFVSAGGSLTATNALVTIAQ